MNKKKFILEIMRIEVQKTSKVRIQLISWGNPRRERKRQQDKVTHLGGKMQHSPNCNHILTWHIKQTGTLEKN